MPPNDNDKRADNDATVHDEVNGYIYIYVNIKTNFFFLTCVISNIVSSDIQNSFL